MTDTPNPVPPSTPPTDTGSPVALGFKTSEFWLKIAAFILSALFASGAIPTTGPVAQVAVIAATMLGALGYTVARSWVKTSAISSTLLLFVLGTLAAWQTACGSTTSSIAQAGAADVVDCTSSDRAKLEAQFGPTVEQALQRATGADGKVDLPSLSQIGSSLEADGWCVLEKEAARLIAAVVSKAPTGTASAVAPLDAPDLAAKLASLRVKKFGATQFQLGTAP